MVYCGKWQARWKRKETERDRFTPELEGSDLIWWFGCNVNWKSTQCVLFIFDPTTFASDHCHLNSRRWPGKVMTSFETITKANVSDSFNITSQVSPKCSLYYCLTTSFCLMLWIFAMSRIIKMHRTQCARFLCFVIVWGFLKNAYKKCRLGAQSYCHSACI